MIFSDLVGSTALQEALDPESVRHVMSRFYAAMQAAIERHGGHVEKFVGDAVMGVFGVPRVREDDALRAARAALDMVTSLEALNIELERDWAVRLGMRTGLNTGEVVVGAAGFIVGDPINVAARLEQAAAPGQVLIGATTARLVRRRMVLEPVAPLDAKGKSEVVVAYALIGSAEGAAATGTRVEAPLVGRGNELEALRGLFAEAVAERSCRLATVIGSPGLGKTRLARELADGLAVEAVVVEGRCEPQGAGITFLPVADVLRDAAGIGDADSADEVRAKLTGLLEGEPDAERIAERDAGVLGLVPPASAEETFWAVRRTLESLARRRPLLVLLDDIHWGQPQFLDLIEHLVQWVVDAPMLVVALARPELRERHDALTRPGAVVGAVIDLEPLGDDHSRTLMSSLLGAEPPVSLVGRVLETTGGNPLFLGETIRMLLEDGVLRRGEDGTIEADAGGIDVPPTITALLEARIERLGADERSVVERAAVIGKQFYRGAVAELAPRPVASRVDAHLEALRLKEMVEPEGTYWIDEPVYRFHHVLIRDAAYRGLLKEARSELHEHFARWLEEKAGELVGEHEEVIAFHLEQAHEYRRELGPLDDRGRALGEQAAGRLGSAGRRALARDDLAAASNLLERALRRLEPAEIADRAELLLDLAEAQLAGGDTAAAEEVVERLRVLAGDDGRLAAWAEVLAGQLATLTGAEQVERTVASVQAAAAALGAAGDRAGEAKAHHVAAQAQALLGRVAAVEESLDRALAAARKADDRRRVTAVLAAAPRAALWGPSPVVRASGRCLDVVRILRMTPGNRHVEAIALRCQAVLEAMRGRTDAARDILAAGRATLEELGLTLELHETAIHAGIVELLAGDPAAAEQHLRAAADGFAALGVDLGAAQASALLARALVDQGRHEDAIAATEEAERRGGGDLKTTITWCGVRAEALARAGEVDAALELARRAVELADPTDALPDKADALMALARVLAAAGREGEVREAATRARELYAAKEHGAGVLAATTLIGGERPAPATPAAPRSGARIPDPEARDFFERFSAGYASRDVTGVTALYHEDYVLVDHRRLGWGEVHGQEGAENQIRAAMGASDDLRFGIDEVHECGGGAVALRIGWRGTSSQTGGQLELPLGFVARLRDGRIWRVHLYEPDDVAAMRARFAELAGGDAEPPPPRVTLGNRPSERWLRAQMDAYAGRDFDALSALAADELVHVDHRNVGLQDMHDRAAWDRNIRSILDASVDLRLDIDELLGVTDTVSAGIHTFRGRGIAAGPFEVSIGAVMAVSADGRATRVDMYEATDRVAIMARFAELAGSEPGSPPPPERYFHRYKALHDAKDLDALVAIHAPDWMMRDHRKVGWDDVHEQAGLRAMLRSGFETSPEHRFDRGEVWACDERVIALRFSWHGLGLAGGEMAIEAGAVCVVEDGAWQSCDLYDPEDRDAMLACYERLGGTGARGLTPTERWVATQTRAFTERDFDACAAQVTADCVQVDHRIVGSHVVRGRAQWEAYVRSILDAPAELRLDAEVIASTANVVASMCIFRGKGLAAGPFEISFATVVQVTDDARAAQIDLYEPSDRDAIMARFHELAEGVPGAHPPQRFWATFVQRFAAREPQELLELYADDWTLIDHRRVGWERMQGREAVAEMHRSAWATSPDLRLDVEDVVACDERVIALRAAWRGTGSERAGALEVPFGLVAVVEDGRLLREEHFEPDDRTAMLDAYRRLGGTRDAQVPERPIEALVAELTRRYNAQDVDGILQLVTDDVAYNDRRTLSLGDTIGREELGRTLRSLFEIAPDGRREIEEMLACADDAIVLRVVYSATSPDAGIGAAERTNLEVWSARDGRLARTDHFDPDDRAGALARYAELTRSGRPPVLGDRPPERLIARYAACLAANDIEAAAACYSDDHVLDDHRALGAEPGRGLANAIESLEIVVRDTPDLRFDIDEVLAVDDRVMAQIAVYRGHSRRARGGAFELRVGHVFVAEDGVMTSVDVYDASDRDAMLARFHELSSRREPQWVAARYARAMGAGDVQRVVALYAPDCVREDHRRLGGDSAVGHEDAAASLEIVLGDAPDVRFEVEETLAVDDQVVAHVVVYRGHSRMAGGGAFELRLGLVMAVADGVATHLHAYDSDQREAMLARYAELGGGQGPLGDRPPERWLAEYVRRFAARELDDVAAMFTEDCELVDRRPLGYETTIGRDGAMEEARSAMEASPGLRYEIEEVLACDDRVAVVRDAWLGRGRLAGEMAVRMGRVIVVEDGRLVFSETYEPDDKATMLTRFAELGGSTASKREPEQVLDAYTRVVDAGDVDGMRALYPDDFVLVDHRKVGWGEVHGPDEMAELYASAKQNVPDVRARIDEAIAADDRVALVRLTWFGGGAHGAGDWETPALVVATAGDGRFATADLYEPEDVGAALARFVELGGGQGPLGDRPPERLWAAFCRAYPARDLGAMRSLYAEDAPFADHRRIPWDDVAGPQGFMEPIESAFAVYSAAWLGLDEVIACDERVLAGRQTWHNQDAATGGWVEIPVGVVAVVEDGRVVSYDQYEPEDREAMLARYAELGGTAAGPAQPASERVFRRSMDAFNRRDRDGLCYAEDIVFVDRRSLAWETLEGREAMTALAASGWEQLSPHVRGSVVEILACDERVIAAWTPFGGAAASGDGGGDFEMPIGQVSVIEGDEIARFEFFDPDDRQAMVARYAELGGGQGPLGDRTVELSLKQYIRAYAAQDLDALQSMVPEDWVLVDHRKLGWGELRGPARHGELMQSGWDAWRDVTLEVDEVLARDDDVLAVRAAFRGTTASGGGRSVIPLGFVMHPRGIDLYEPEERDRMLTRYAELSEAAVSAAARPPQRWLTEYIRRWETRDVPSLMELYAEDFVLVDHRAMGWETVRGLEQAEQLARSAAKVGPELRMEVDEILACDDRLIVACCAFRGPGVKAGELDYPMIAVQLVEDGRWVSSDLYDAGDARAAIARYVELGGGQGVLGDQPPERWWARYAQLRAAREIDTVVPMFSPDGVFTDHRAMGWDTVRGHEAVVSLIESGYAVADPIHLEFDEVIACADDAIGVRYTWHFLDAAGGGPGRLSVGIVAAFEDGLCTSYDQYEPDDREAMLRRFAELTRREPERVIAEYARLFTAKDLEGALELVTDDCVVIDRRAISLWAELHGREGLRSLWASFGRYQGPAQLGRILACDDRVMAHTIRFWGTGRKGVDYEIEMGAVTVVENGRWTHAELFEPDDDAGMLARFAELAGGAGPESARAPEAFFAEYRRRNAARDVDAMLELYDEDFVLVDHRSFGWTETRGRDQVRRVIEQSFELQPWLSADVDQVLACDDRVIAMRWTIRSEAAPDVGGGPSETPLGCVAVIEDGRWKRCDYYEPDDDAAMLQRFGELTTGRAVLGDSPIERLFADVTRTFNEHDLPAHLALHADDFLIADQRPVGWGDARGEAAFDAMRSAMAVSDDVRFEISEVLACDGERVLAGRGAWRSDGSRTAGGWEIPVAFVTVGQGGRLRSHDLYEYDNVEAAMARYRELAGAIPEPERLWREIVALHAPQDIEALMPCYADDFALVDHRHLALWDEMRGRADVRRFLESVMASFTVLRGEVDEVLACDDRVIAVRVTWRGVGADSGGEVVVAVGNVLVFEDGLCVRQDLYEPDDDEAMMARYAELSPAVAAIQRYVDAYDARDWEALGALFAPDAVLVDRRPAGLGELGGAEAVLQAIRGFVELAPDARTTAREILASGEPAVLYRHEVTGHDARGGAAEIAMLMLATVGDGGFGRVEMFDLADEAAARERFEQLR